MKIYVGNLSTEVTEADLQEAFEEFGKIKSLVITKEKDSGQSKGYGFVEMASKSKGYSAIEGLNGKEFKGQELIVDAARSRTQNQRNQDRTGDAGHVGFSPAGKGGSGPSNGPKSSQVNYSGGRGNQGRKGGGQPRGR